MSETTTPATGSRRMKYVLIGSLALNLLFIGAVIGMGFKKPHHGPRGKPHYSLMGLTRVLPSEQRKEVVEILKKEHAEMAPAIDELRKARHEAADRLAAEPFDRAALERAIAEVTEKERALRQGTLDMFLTQAERLDADQRKKLSERWHRRADWLAHRRRSKKKD